MLSEYMEKQEMEYFKVNDAQQVRLINNYKNKKDKHDMDMQ